MIFADVSRELIAERLYVMLPMIVLGIVQTMFALLVFWFGFRRGWHRGVKDTPNEIKKAMDQARFERAVAEERLDTERKMSKRLEVMVRQLVESKDDERSNFFGIPIKLDESLPDDVVIIKNVGDKANRNKFKVVKP